jgi:hypothetical protein
MGRCSHAYNDDPDRQCPHQATEGAAYCIWHNPNLRKTDAYVGLLLERLLPRLADLDGFLLPGLRWSKARLPQLSLTGIDLRDALLPFADLHGSQLRQAVLRRATLVDADLSGVDLSGADLTMANLQGADLRGARLREAILVGANLRGADLRDADLVGAVLDNFAWNRHTRFSGIAGFDPEGEATLAGEDDETQVYAAPLALGSHHSADLPSGSWNPEWERTHLYRSGISDRQGLEARRPSEALLGLEEDQFATPASGSRLQPSAPKPVAPTPARRFHPSHGYYALLAASLLLTMIACGFILVLKNHLDRGQDRITQLAGELAATQQQPVVDQSTKPPGELQQRIEQRDRQYDRLVEENGQLQEERRQLLSRIETLVNDNTERRLALSRLETRDNLMQELRDRHQTLEREHADLLLQNQRLHDTARILNKGIESLQVEHDELAEFKQKHVNDYYNYTRLQASVDQLRKENTTLTARSKSMQLINESLQQRLQEAEQSLNTFLAHLEGSRLKEYLSRGNDDEPSIPIEAGKPVVFGGEYVLTVRIDPDEEAGMVRARLVVQRPPHKHMPDVNLLLYGRSGEIIRGISASFPANEPGKAFASIDTRISCSEFPQGIRVLVNPALDPGLLVSSQP